MIFLLIAHVLACVSDIHYCVLILGISLVHICMQNFASETKNRMFLRGNAKTHLVSLFNVEFIIFQFFCLEFIVLWAKTSLRLTI